MIDPPSSDVTAHVLEALAAGGRKLDDPAVAQAVSYLRSEQEDDGSWFGRWGVNHIYGTAAVLPALPRSASTRVSPGSAKGPSGSPRGRTRTAVGARPARPIWMPTFEGIGTSTASQTGWALMGLLTIETRGFDKIIRRGVEFLLEHQVNGTWNEPEYTGTGFPGYGVGHRVDLEHVAEGLRAGHRAATRVHDQLQPLPALFPTHGPGPGEESFRDGIRCASIRAIHVTKGRSPTSELSPRSRQPRTSNRSCLLFLIASLPASGGVSPCLPPYRSTFAVTTVWLIRSPSHGSNIITQAR